jgi:RNA polymerase sigma-70 factor (ECF subfamily)
MAHQETPREEVAPAAGSARTDAEQGTSLTLLQRLRSNEPDAWRRLVQLYTPLVYHWCNRQGLRHADADDLVQEVFQAVSTSLEQFRRDRPGDTFRGWLRGITRNLILVHFRRQGRQPLASGGTDAFQKLQEVPAGGVSAEEADADPAEEVTGLYRRALELVRGHFEERTWQGFWQTVVEGRSPVDVAADLGVSPTAIRMAKSRVLRRLKEEVGDLIQ